jgi:hypothetical protein
MGECRIISTYFLTSALDGSEWSAWGPGRFSPRKGPRYPLGRKLGGPKSRSIRGGEEKIKSVPLPGIEPSRRARGLVTILTEISLLTTAWFSIKFSTAGSTPTVVGRTSFWLLSAQCNTYFMWGSNWTSHISKSCSPFTDGKPHTKCSVNIYSFTWSVFRYGVYLTKYKQKEFLTRLFEPYGNSGLQNASFETPIIDIFLIPRRPLFSYQ